MGPLGKIQAKSTQFTYIFYVMFQAPAPAENFQKFARFINLFYVMFQAPTPAENSQEFQRIMQIPRDSPT